MFCALTDVGVEEQKHCDGFLFCWLVLLVLNESTSVMAMRRPPVVPRVPKGLQRSVAQRLSLSLFFASIRQKANLLRRICMLRICMNFISRNNSRIEHSTAPGGSIEWASLLAIYIRLGAKPAKKPVSIMVGSIEVLA